MNAHTRSSKSRNFDEAKEFTKLARKKIGTVINAEDFHGQSAEMIYEYLLSQKSHVTFCDHLKRYLYEHTHFDKPYSDITINEYAEQIIRLFNANNIPISLQPTTRKPLATVKKWLTQGSVNRSIIFQLGFGLKMTVQDVDAFLKKAISESTFNMADYEEVIYQYCFYNQLAYSRAITFLDYYQSIETQQNPLRIRAFALGK